MRIAAPTSSVAEVAPPVSPTIGARLDALVARRHQIDWTPWMIIGLGAFLRLFLLGIKPPHFDEGINGWFVDQMVKNGFYRYDPTNYHGPLHFYILFLFQTIFGRSIWVLRMPVVLTSISCVWLTMKFEPFVGRRTSRLAALAMAVSPAFVFYGRYSIHEVWMLLFSMFFVMGILGLWKFGSRGYLWCLGMGITGMILTKETYILHLGCAAIALGVCWVINRLRPVADQKFAAQTWDAIDLMYVIGSGVALIVFFYSGTFFHFSGLKGLYQCFSAWFETGTEGHGHDKPPFYWLKLIGRYELPVLVGLIMCLVVDKFNASLRFLAVNGVGVLMAYSIIHYKTPWCIISIVWPLLFLFGAGLILLKPAKQFLGAIVAGAILLESLVHCIYLNYFACTTESEPYVYVQTFNDMFKFTDPILKVARRDPVLEHMVGHIIRTSSYPLPWVLGDFPNVGYYEKNNLPGNVDADFLLVQEDRIKEVEEKLTKPYYTVPLTLRAFQEPSKAYFDAKRFRKYFSDQEPDFKGKGPG